MIPSFVYLAVNGLASDEGAQEPPPAPAVGAHAGELERCYERRLLMDPSLAGRIEVAWRVVGGEVVGRPTVRSDSTGDGRLARCVVRKLRRWPFPPDLEGEFSSPFIFQPRPASASPDADSG